MSNTEIPPDQVYEIDQDTFDQIDKIVHDVKTRYTNWVSFVDEAVRIFATWWTNPPDALPIFQHELWPHMISEQHEVMKNNSKEIYQKQKEYCEKYHTEKGTLHPGKMEVDSITQNNARKELKINDYLTYKIDKTRYKEIKRIILQAKNTAGTSRFYSSSDFMVLTLDLFITWWNNPPDVIDMMCELFPFLTKKQYQHWYSLDPREEGDYMMFKKQVEEYHIKRGNPVSIDDGIEQLVKQKKIEEQYKQAELHYEKDLESMELDDDMENQVLREAREEYDPFDKQNLDRVKKQIKNMKEKGVFKKPNDALLSDTYQLIRPFYNRFFPIKLTLTVLADFISHNNGEPVDYNFFREEVFSYIVNFSEELKEKEKKFKNPDETKGLDRTKKISTGLPLTRPTFPVNANDEQEEKYTKIVLKWKSSKERFLEQYIGPTTKQWNRTKKDQDGDSIFDGALNSMDLVSITEDSDGRLKINFTKKGADFYDKPNDILDNFPNIQLEKHKPISSKECVFLMENVIKKKPFSLELKLINSVYSTLKGAKDQRAFGSELDISFKEPLREIASQYDDPERKKKFLEGVRQATMGRLSEIGLVDWTIYGKKNGKDTDKYGKSYFVLNESMKNNW